MDPETRKQHEDELLQCLDYDLPDDDDKDE
jgi:hypothetical protein